MFLLGILCALAACTPPPIDISLQRSDDRTLLGFTQDWGVVFSDRKVPCIEQVSLLTAGASNDGNAFWAIKVDGGQQCLDLPSLEIGQVPKGWQEITPLKAVPGQTYTVQARGIGWGVASVTF